VQLLHNIEKMQQEKLSVEDEIDLKELFKIIWKRKIFVISFCLLITIGSVIYVYTKTPIYEVKSVMEIGFFVQLLHNIEYRKFL
jgi:uncharacterized protein involved in exopolysaccharide biosynthesis